MDELCLDSLKRDKQISIDFEEMVEKLKRWIETIEESKYKEGMQKALKDAGYL